MALSVNDLETKARQIAYLVADTNAVVTGSVRLMGIVVTAGAAAAADVVVNNALTTGGGGTTLQVNVVTGASRHVDFGPNGVRFDTGISADITGASAAAMITYIAE